MSQDKARKYKEDINPRDARLHNRPRTKTRMVVHIAEMEDRDPNRQ
jgi:hypothetical protein